MYFDYLREREPEMGILEKDQGFALYKELSYYGERAVYIQDIYVHPDFRDQDIASQMSEEIQEIARQDGIKYLLGTVVPSAKGSHASMQVLIAHGMKLVSSENDLLWFVKEI